MRRETELVWTAGIQMLVTWKVLQQPIEELLAHIFSIYFAALVAVAWRCFNTPILMEECRIYSNKRRGAFLIFRVTSAAFIRGRRLFKKCTRQIYFYLLIFLWTDTKLIVNLELREKFTLWKKPESFMITRAKLSAMRANSFVVVEQFTTFSQFWCHCLRIGGEALIRGWRLLTFLSQMRRLFE